MSQLTLFEDETREQRFEPKSSGIRLARTSDPDTSKQAANATRPKIRGLHAEFVCRLQLLGRATAQEVARGHESLRKRAKELVNCGLIREVGTRECKVTGKNATVYEVV